MHLIGPSSRQKVRATIVAVTVALGLGLVSARADGRVVDANASAGQIDAADGYAVWSKPSKGNRFRLVIRHAGRTRSAGVASRPGPFDVSLGRDSRRRVVATYSRCRVASGRQLRNCRLWALDVRSGRERRLRLRSSSAVMAVEVV